MPSTSMPLREKVLAALPITALAAGAGPPEKRIATRRISVSGRGGLESGVFIVHSITQDKGKGKREGKKEKEQEMWFRLHRPWITAFPSPFSPLFPFPLNASSSSARSAR